MERYNRLYKPRGSQAQKLQERQYLIEFGDQIGQDTMAKAYQKLSQLTDNNFRYGMGVIIPDLIETESGVISPMLYINECYYGILSQELSTIPELIIYDD